MGIDNLGKIHVVAVLRVRYGCSLAQLVNKDQVRIVVCHYSTRVQEFKMLLILVHVYVSTNPASFLNIANNFIATPTA